MKILVRSAIYLSSLVLLLPGVSLYGQGSQQPTRNQTQDIADATNGLNRLQKFTFRYDMAKGEEIRWDVEQIASGSTKVAEFSEEYSIRTSSTKFWKVVEVDSRGNMTFENMVERLAMWNKKGDEEPVSYDSEKDTEVPPEFVGSADFVGVVSGRITISPSGRVVHRDTENQGASFGAGNITVPFPEKPIGIGHQWSVPFEMTARHEGQVKKIKWRHLYTLESVENQIARIKFKSEILTPIEEPAIRAQVMQKVNYGHLTFDLAKGRLLEKEINWSEKVLGHSGGDSSTEMLGRLTEKLRVPRVSNNKSVTNETDDVLIKPNDGKPILRKR